MMFISELMERIREPYSRLYQQYMIQFESLGDQELLERIMNLVKQSEEQRTEEIGNYVITGLKTCGCPHWNKNGVIGGCSFCDFFSDNFEGFALLAVLKKKNAALYGQVVRDSLLYSREKGTTDQITEHITGFDSLNENEVDPEIVENIFGRKNGVFKNGLFYLMCETRATSITKQSIQHWKKNVRKKLMIESGVETGDAWLRNHWLNKDITDQDLYCAREITKAEDCLFMNDILIGIPGLSDRQSIDIFLHSFRFCRKMGSDLLIISPLLCKGNDMQSVITNYFLEDREMKDAGIVQTKHIGVHIMTVFTALYRALMDEPEFANRIQFAPGHLKAYCQYAESELTEEKERTHEIAQVLLEFNRTKDILLLHKLYDSLSETTYYQEYCTNLKKQDGIRQIKQTMLLTAKKLTRLYWDEQYESKMNEFVNELEQFNDQVFLNL